MNPIATFIEHLRHDSELLRQLQAITDEEALIERTVIEARARGFTLDAEELDHYINHNRADAELSDQDLAEVSGGGTGFWCVVSKAICDS